MVCGNLSGDVAPRLPIRVVGTYGGYSITVTGGGSFYLNLAEYVETYGGSETDLWFIKRIIDGQIAANGAQNTYDISASAYSTYMNMLADEDFYEAAPEEVSKTSKQVSRTAPNYTEADEFLFSFTSSSSTTLTLPEGVLLADKFDFSTDKGAGVKFQVSIKDGMAAYLCLTPPSNS